MIPYIVWLVNGVVVGVNLNRTCRSADRTRLLTVLGEYLPVPTVRYQYVFRIAL